MQTSKVSCYLLMHLAILLLVLQVHSCEGQSWEDFQKKHVDFPRSQAPNFNVYCAQMMVRRQLNPQFCKTHNTFINSDPTVIQLVCTTGGTHFSGNLFDSNQYFDMVDCNNVGGTAPINCRYSGKCVSHRIRVACSNNLPVHFQAILPYAESDATH